MVCGDGCILRTHKVLGKGVVYAFIWHVILGVRMVSFLCHGILLIRIQSCDMLYYILMEHVISLFEMVRSCCHVYVPEAMVGTLTLILVQFLGIEYTDHKLDTS